MLSDLSAQRQTPDADRDPGSSAQDAAQHRGLDQWPSSPRLRDQGRSSCHWRKTRQYVTSRCLGELERDSTFLRRGSPLQSRQTAHSRIPAQNRSVFACRRPCWYGSRPRQTKYQDQPKARTHRPSTAVRPVVAPVPATGKDQRARREYSVRQPAPARLGRAFRRFSPARWGCSPEAPKSVRSRYRPDGMKRSAPHRVADRRDPADCQCRTRTASSRPSKSDRQSARHPEDRHRRSGPVSSARSVGIALSDSFFQNADLLKQAAQRPAGHPHPFPRQDRSATRTRRQAPSAA